MSIAQLELCKKAPFFGAEGLTSTSANFIANKAKEMYDALERDNRKINFLHQDYKVIDKEVFRVTASSDETIFETIKTNLKRIGKLKALIAWLREGIKLKDETKNWILHYTLQEYVKDILKVELPITPSLNIPSDDELDKEFSYEKLQRGLELQAQAACIGQYIHPKGTLSTARKEFLDLKGKTTIKGEGTETTFITYVAAIDGKILEDNYLELQELQRKYQAELNGIRHEIELKKDEAKRAATLKYKDELVNYNKAISEYQLSYKEWVNDTSKEVSELKIVIPDSLKEIYGIVKGA